MDTFQIVQHLPVHLGQFFVQADRPVSLSFLALLCIGAAAAILADVDLFLASVPIPFDGFSVGELEFLFVRTAQVPLLICFEIDRPEGIIVLQSPLFQCQSRI